MKLSSYLMLSLSGGLLMLAASSARAQSPASSSFPKPPPLAPLGEWKDYLTCKYQDPGGEYSYTIRLSRVVAGGKEYPWHLRANLGAVGGYMHDLGGDDRCTQIKAWEGGRYVYLRCTQHFAFGETISEISHTSAPNSWTYLQRSNGPGRVPPPTGVNLGSCR